MKNLNKRRQETYLCSDIMTVNGFAYYLLLKIVTFVFWSAIFVYLPFASKKPLFRLDKMQDFGQ